LIENFSVKLHKAITRFLLAVIALFFNKVYGQLCQGSVGDPVVSITFGSGANPGAPLPSGVTNYNYVSSCPNDGNYTIASSTDVCFNGSWHALTEDHTAGDVNGYMMVVNASYAPGDFYVQTVGGLCGGTTYEFASWILNIQKSNACGGNPIKPNVTFNIETTNGTVLMSYKSGDIPSTPLPTWKQYGFYFTTPPGISNVVIRLTNNAPGGCGNDIALDDITFRPCGALVTANINGLNTSKDVCVGDTSSFTLSANVSNSYSSVAYQWQTSIDNGINWKDVQGDTSTTYIRKATATPGKYMYRVAIAQVSNIGISSCRVVSDVITINVNALPIPSASNNSPKCEADSVMLNASNGILYNWTGPASFKSTSKSPLINNVSVNDAGKYYVNVINDKGCMNSDSTIVSILKRPAVSAGADTTICEGTNIRLKGAASNANAYLWTPSAGLSANNITNPVAAPKDTTRYIFTATNGSCSNLDSVTINVLKKPTANAGADVQIVQGQSVILNGVAAGQNISYYWSPNYFITLAATLHPVVSPPADTTYTLHVVSNAGCGTASDNVFVKVYKALIIPNAFSPNNDGINDTWNIAALQTYPNAEVSVFNRHGQLVFYNKGYTKQWNGTYNSKPLPVATYYYIIDLKDGRGILSGSVSILK
jgi:gliding motility-associated-like protein